MGRICPNSPEFSVLVVDAQIISVCAEAFVTETEKTIINTVNRFAITLISNPP
jgi:hypothetical protein